MKNSEKLILDLCGGTGAWSKPYAKAGYKVINVTLPAYDIRKFIPPEKVYGILAAPPCTEFSKAKNTRPRDFNKGIEVVRACLEIIWKIRTRTKITFWALENPVGILRQFLGKPAYTFQPWWFDKAAQPKRTDLWGYFNEPRRKIWKEPKDLFDKRWPNRANARAWTKPDYPKEYKHLNLSRADLRAITPQGFAKAFYEANK